MNKKKYILLRYTVPNSNDCEIYAISGNQKIKLNEADKAIMRKNRILQKFKSIKINDNTYLYPNYTKITLLFIKARLKSKSKKIDRNKSKKVIVGIALVTTLAVGVVGCNIIIQNSNEKEQGDISIVYETEPNMLMEDIFTFNYEYETPNDKEALNNAIEYIDIFKKYEEMYGVDANLLCAIGAQESSGIHHKESINGGYATGIMGIEYIWDESNIQIFNFKTNSYETITVDYSKIGELDYNIKIGAAIFQNYFYHTLNNLTYIDKTEALAFTIQKYNMGPGNMNKILNIGYNWIDNRDLINAGDKYYFEHVLSRLDNDTVIRIRLADGSYYKTKVVNIGILEKKVTKTSTM